jgi:hypothetical protein
MKSDGDVKVCVSFPQQTTPPSPFLASIVLPPSDHLTSSQETNVSSESLHRFRDTATTCVSSVFGDRNQAKVMQGQPQTYVALSRASATLISLDEERPERKIKVKAEPTSRPPLGTAVSPAFLPFSFSAAVSSDKEPKGHRATLDHRETPDQCTNEAAFADEIANESAMRKLSVNETNLGNVISDCDLENKREEAVERPITVVELFMNQAGYKTGTLGSMVPTVSNAQMKEEVTGRSNSSISKNESLRSSAVSKVLHRLRPSETAKRANVDGNGKSSGDGEESEEKKEKKGRGEILNDANDDMTRCFGEGVLGQTSSTAALRQFRICTPLKVSPNSTRPLSTLPSTPLLTLPSTPLSTLPSTPLSTPLLTLHSSPSSSVSSSARGTLGPKTQSEDTKQKEPSAKEQYSGKKEKVQTKPAGEAPQLVSDGIGFMYDMVRARMKAQAVPFMTKHMHAIRANYLWFLREHKNSGGPMGCYAAEEFANGQLPLGTSGALRVTSSTTSKTKISAAITMLPLHVTRLPSTALVTSWMLPSSLLHARKCLLLHEQAQIGKVMNPCDVCLWFLVADRSIAKLKGYLSFYIPDGVRHMRRTGVSDADLAKLFIRVIDQRTSH